MGDKVLGKVVEWYEVPRDRAIIDTPGWQGVAGGGRARRYWVHERVLVGGSILDRVDGQHLRDDYGITHVASFESERIDHGKGWPRARLCWCPFVDVGAPIHPHLLVQALDFAADVLGDPVSVLYAHCQMGGGRGPSLAYLVCVGVLGERPADVLERIHAVGSNPHTNYLRCIDDAIREWKTAPLRDAGGNPYPGQAP